MPLSRDTRRSLSYILYRAHAAHAHARCFCGASGAVLTRWQFVGARVAAASAARSDRDVMLPRSGVAAGARRPRGGVGGRAHVRARAFERRHLYNTSTLDGGWEQVELPQAGFP